MSRKRRRRTRSTATASAPVVSAPVVSAPVTAAADASAGAKWSGLVVPVLQHAVCVLLWVGMVLLVGALVGLVVLRWRRVSGTWPALDEVGLSVLWPAIGLMALIASSVVVWMAWRAGRGGRMRTARLCRLIALALAALVLGLRLGECYALYQNGVVPWSLETSVYDEASVYYVSAVKERLRGLGRDLEARRTEHPDRFSDADRRRLDLVTTLQTSLVGWTEREVGHWLDDTQLRRDLIEVMAYQIHPTARRRDTALRRIEVERGDLERRRQCFLVLRDYCRQQPAPGPPQAGALLESLRRLGAGQWAFADAVLRDAPDATMIGERLNQIETSLSSMDARAAFVREYLDPLRDAPAADGLNRTFPGLRLPVSFSQARAWTLSYVLLTGLHSVVLVLAALMLFVPPRGRDVLTHGVPRTMCLRGWHAAVIVGIFVFVGVYGL